MKIEIVYVFEIKVGHCSTNSGTLLIDGEEIWVNENGFAQISKQKIKQIIFNPGICYAEINFNITDTTANYFQIELKNSFEPAFTCSTKYIKKITKLIPVIYDSVLTEFTLRRKFVGWLQ